MSFLGAALVLVQALPASPAVLLSRLLLLVYLAARADYRQEIGLNYQTIMGRRRPWFWVRNAWRVGRNLALMARIGQKSAEQIIDTAAIRPHNVLLSLERELHTVMASFHFGAWEYLPHVFACRGRTITLTTGRQSDTGLGTRLNRVRRSTRVRLARTLREVVEAGQRPGITGFMLDNTSQGHQEAVEVEGIRLRMPTLPFTLAARRGAGVVPAFARFERGRLSVEVAGPGDARHAARALLEQVRRHPEEWVFWGKSGAVS